MRNANANSTPKIIIIIEMEYEIFENYTYICVFGAAAGAAGLYIYM